MKVATVKNTEFEKRKNGTLDPSFWVALRPLLNESEIGDSDKYVFEEGPLWSNTVNPVIDS